MFQATHLIGFGSKRAAAGGGGPGTLIPYNTYSALIGDMTVQGGLVAAFDNSYNVTFGSSASSHPTTRTSHYVGKDWGSGVTYTLDRYTVYAPTDIGFGNNGGHTFTIQLYGSNSAPANSSDGTQLHSVAGIAYANDDTQDFTSGITTTTAYRYHWVRLVPSSTASGFIAEIDFYGY